MLDSPIIDIAIGLSFLYFLLGLFASSFNELIQIKLQSRSKQLHLAIINFLDRDWDEIGTKIMDSPYIRSLRNNKNELPSYIPSSSFAQSVIDVIKGAEDLPETIPQIREQIKNNKIIKGDAQVWLLGLLDKSYNKLEDFYENIETSYNDSMDRLSEWYKTKAKMAVLYIGILSAVLLNIDTINITTTLWKNKDTAKAFSAAVASSMVTIEKNDEEYLVKDANGEVIYSGENKPGDNLANVFAEVGSLPIPLGWSRNSFDFFSEDDWYWGLLSMLAGWAITSLAIYIGAPFWFDLLSKVVKLRGGVKNIKIPVGDS